MDCTVGSSLNGESPNTLPHLTKATAFDHLLSCNYKEFINTCLSPSSSSSLSSSSTSSSSSSTGISDGELSLPFIINLINTTRSNRDDDDGDNNNNGEDDDDEHNIGKVMESELISSDNMSPHLASSISIIQQYYSLDAQSFYFFIQEEQIQRKKLSHMEKKGSLIESITMDIGREFEMADHSMRLKLVLSDLIGLMDYAEKQRELLTLKLQQPSSTLSLSSSSSDLDYLSIINNSKYDSDLFLLDIYQTELCFILPIIYYKFNQFIPLNSMIVSILLLPQAPFLIKVLILNNPSEFRTMIELIIDCIDLVGYERIRKVLLELCTLSHYSATLIRKLLLEKQLMPDFIFTITSTFIQYDIVTFMSNIIVNRSECLWIKDYLTKSYSSDLTTTTSSNISSSSSSFQEIRDQLLNILTSLTFNQQQQQKQQLTGVNNQIERSLKIKSIIRLYCGMGGLLGIKLNLQEISTCLSLIDGLQNTTTTQQQQQPISTPWVTKAFSKIYLCFLLVCEGILKVIPYKRIVECLNGLLRTGYCDDLLLLISIYFHTRQLHNIVYVIKNTLGFRPSIHTESLNQMGELITKDIFPEALVALKASLLPTIDQLSARSSSTTTNHSISTMCIYHLLSERIFEKYETDMSNWIWEQTLKATTPIHYLLPSCLDKLIKNIIEATITTNSPLFYMTRIKEQSILSVFSSSSSSSTTKYNEAVQVLVVYYVLRYNDSVLKLKTDYNFKGKSIPIGMESSQLREYSIEFLSKIPIQRCLAIVQNNVEDYFFILPPFMYLVSSQFPQFFNVHLLLSDEEKSSNKISKFDYNLQYYQDSLRFLDGRPQGTRRKKTQTEEEEEELISIVKLQNKLDVGSILSSPTSIQLILCHLSREIDIERVRRLYMDVLIDRLLPVLVHHRRKLESLIPTFTNLWLKVFPVSDQSSMALKTINILTSNNYSIYNIDMDQDKDNDIDMTDPQQQQNQSSAINLLSYNQYSHSDVMSDPLIVFRCHPNVFSNPSLFSILLQILYFYMISSKKYLLNQIQISQQKKQEDIKTLILTQESSIIQLLLELCIVDRIVGRDILSMENDIIVNNNSIGTENRDGDRKKTTSSPEKEYDAGDMDEIRCMICNFIHQLFIEKPILVKLVHFQGYFAQLLPITVTHIPSMHICLDFLPELLSQAQLEKQIFSIQLCAFLSEKYPIPKSLRICKQALHRISTNLSTGASPSTPNPFALPINDQIDFIKQILPSFTRFSKAFPILSEDCLHILIDLLPSKLSNNNGIPHHPLHPSPNSPTSSTFFTPSLPSDIPSNGNINNIHNNNISNNNNYHNMMALDDDNNSNNLMAGNSIMRSTTPPDSLLSLFSPLSQNQHPTNDLKREKLLHLDQVNNNNNRSNKNTAATTTIDENDDWRQCIDYKKIYSNIDTNNNSNNNNGSNSDPISLPNSIIEHIHQTIQIIIQNLTTV